MPAVRLRRFHNGRLFVGKGVERDAWLERLSDLEKSPGLLIADEVEDERRTRYVFIVLVYPYCTVLMI